MNTEKIFELIAMISQLKTNYPTHEDFPNTKMLGLIDHLENLLLKEIIENG
jgi:hypothetical protein